MRVFKAAKIYPVVGQPIEEGMMKVDSLGKIVELGKNLDLDGAELIDFSDKILMPGLIDAHSHVGMWGDGEGAPGYDGNEIVRAITGEVRALDAMNPLQPSFESAREGGVTTIQVVPGSGNPIGGLAFACKTQGTIIDDMVVKSPTGLKGALGENPKGAHGGQGHSPTTRMGTAAIIRQYFKDAKKYGEEKKKAQEEGKAFKKDYNLESGLMVLNKEIPFRVHAHRHDDIVTAVRISGEFGIDYSIEHCTDGHLVADFLGEKKATCLLGPGLTSRVKVELANYTDKNPAILYEKGARVCLMSDHPFLNCKYLLHYGAICHKHGLPFEATLEALTITPAQVLGIEDRVGSLEVGKDADFIVLNGQPLSYKGSIARTYIEGELVWEREQY